MTATLTALFTAHLLGDFILQTDWTIQRKRRTAFLLLHVIGVTSVSYILLGTFHWRILLAIFSSHLALDAIKIHFLPDRLAPFLADQAAHVAVLLGLAWYFPEAAKAGWWIAGLRPDLSKWYFASLTCLSGFVLCVPAGGLLIARLVGRFTRELHEDFGLAKGGQYIGWLERALVMLLLLTGQPNGIGFLIAAKSILRFGEIKDASQRKLAEYIIIGTFASFAWALLVSTLTQKAIQYWLP